MFKSFWLLVWYAVCGLGVSWLAALVLQTLWILPAWIWGWGAVFWLHRFLWFTITWAWWLGSWAFFWWTPVLMWLLSWTGSLFWGTVWLVLNYWHIALYVVHILFAYIVTGLPGFSRATSGFGMLNWEESKALSEYACLHLSKMDIKLTPGEQITLDHRKRQINRFYKPIAIMYLKIAIWIIIPLVLQIIDWKALPAFPYRVAGTIYNSMTVMESIRSIVETTENIAKERPHLKGMTATDWRTKEFLFLLQAFGCILLQWVVIPPIGMAVYNAARWVWD